jgi:hypothetical protein
VIKGRGRESAVYSENKKIKGWESKNRQNIIEINK